MCPVHREQGTGVVPSAGVVSRSAEGAPWPSWAERWVFYAPTRSLSRLRVCAYCMKTVDAISSACTYPGLCPPNPRFEAMPCYRPKSWGQAECQRLASMNAGLCSDGAMGVGV